MVARVLRRQPLERAILVVVPLAVFGVALSSSWSTTLQDVGHPVRALGLAALAALSLAYAATAPSARFDAAVAAAGAVFVAVVTLSAAWSVEPRHSIARAFAFALVLVIAAAVATGAAGDEAAARRLLWSLVAGAGLVAVAGLLVAIVSPHDSVQAATRSVGRRYRGIGVNPNTAVMLYAVALPLTAALWLGARTRSAGALATAAFLLLAGSIVAAGSRGAAAAAAGGLVVLALAHGPGRTPRVVAAGAAVAVAVTAALVTAVSAPLTAAEAAHVKSPAANTERYTPNDAEYIARLADEIGSGAAGESRSIFDTSGRLQAWRGALHQAEHRPLLGYGFGSEEAVFVDRYRSFEGGVPEDSFVGVFLQLGVVGLGLFVVFLATLAVAGLRAVRAGGQRGAVALAVMTTGIVLALVQSYIYAVGNIATLAFWLCVFLPTAARARG